MVIKESDEITNTDNLLIYNLFLKLVEKKKHDVLNAETPLEEKQKIFSLEAIKKAVKIIANYKDKIISGKQLKKISGIGDRIAKRIDEIIETNKLEELTKDVNYINTSELEKIYGIGRKKALELIQNNNIKTIDELKNAYDNNKIDLPDNIVKGLKYYDKIQQKIPRTEMLKIDNLLHDIIYSIDSNLYGQLCGSYRREKLTSNDIDFLFTYTGKKMPKKNFIEILVNKLKSLNLIIDSLTNENVKTKYMGLFQLDNKLPIRRIDIRFVKNNEFYSALLYFTGSAEFNKNMRLHALELGYTLNEYGIYKIEENNSQKLNKFDITSEKDIFDILQLEYIEPKNR